MNTEEPLFSELKNQPAYKQIADKLQRAVMDKHLKPGDLLPIETELAIQFGVNRSTIREGIRHLEQTGLVERKGKRLIVSRPGVDQVGDQVSRVLVAHDVTFRELWETQMPLELLAARLAAGKTDPAMIARLERNLEATALLSCGDLAIVELDLEFHALIAEASGNKALLMAREALARLFFPAFKIGMFPQTAASRLLEAHTHIVNAIKLGDEDRAVDWMHKHIVDFRRGYELAGRDLDSPVPFQP